MPVRNLAVVSFAFVFLILSGSSLAASLDINLHSDALRLTFAKDMDRSLMTDVGALFLDRRPGNRNRDGLEDNEVALHAGVHLKNQNLRFGVRALYVTPGDVDILALGFGLQGNMSLSRNVVLSGHFYYAPEATSFLDGEGYRELALRLNLRLNHGTFIYLGYRSLEIEFGDRRQYDWELDEDVHIGLKFYF